MPLIVSNDHHFPDKISSLVKYVQQNLIKFNSECQSDSNHLGKTIQRLVVRIALYISDSIHMHTPCVAY